VHLLRGPNGSKRERSEQEGVPGQDGGKRRRGRRLHLRGEGRAGTGGQLAWSNTKEEARVGGEGSLSLGTKKRTVDRWETKTKFVADNGEESILDPESTARAKEKRERAGLQPDSAVVDPKRGAWGGNVGGKGMECIVQATGDGGRTGSEAARGNLRERTTGSI